jgi:ABC-type Mn2+/Zn2+ transport system ATPase subunit
VIHKLTLHGFGKFRRAEFDLSGVTVVYGPNEAGKTTFFDGLFQALCRPSEAKLIGKQLKSRYGSGRIAEAVLSNDVPITDEEFMNLYAIRAGDLKLEFDKGTEWLDGLKSRLFHGGVDPNALLAEFEKRSSDAMTHAHNKDAAKAREAAAHARRELEARKRERSDLLGKEASLGAAEAALAETRRLREAAAQELAALEKHAALEDRIGLRQKWTAQLARLEDWDALQASAAELAPYQEDRREEWNRWSAAAKGAQAALLAEKGKREQQSGLVAKARAELRQAKEAREAAGPRSALAARLAEAARKTLAEPAPSGRIPWWGPAAAILLLPAGIAGIFVLGGPAGYAVAVLGLVSAVAATALAMRTGKAAHRTAAAETLRRKLSSLKDQWAVGAPGASAGAGEVSTLEGFIQAMDLCARERENLKARESESAKRLEAHEDALEKIEAALRALKDEEDAAERAVREWLSRQGALDFEEYLLKVTRARHVRSDLEKRRAELESLAEGKDWDALRRELRRKLQALDEDGVAEKGRDDAGLQRLRRRREELASEQEQLVRKEQDLIGNKERLAGEISGAMGKLAPAIVEWEDRLAKAEEDIRVHEVDKRAAALVRDIFRDLGDGADLMLKGLAGEMEAMLGNILPKGRTVSLLGLADKHIQVLDAGGGSRSLEQLSTGTKHAMVLAAKLAMALKHRQGPGILVLDEPFLAMDDERESRALELLRDFHGRNGWQIILLTKESHLLEKVRKTFSGPRIIDLSLTAA